MNDSHEISQETALRLLAEGNTFVFHGVPKGTQFGIDKETWVTDSQFLGLKMIPPGLHYIYYSTLTSHGNFTPRTGFVWFAGKGQIKVKKWDEKTNLFVDEPEAVEKIKNKLLDIDKNLGPYPFTIWKKWRSLTNKISEKLIQKMLPDDGVIQSVVDDVPRKRSERSAKKKVKQTRRGRRQVNVNFYGDLMSDYLGTVGTKLGFVKFPELCYPADSTPAQITQHSLDASYVLREILRQHESPEEFLGEYQLAFVAFLVGHNLDAYEHWKRLLGVLSSVKVDLNVRTSLYSHLMILLKYQLAEIPSADLSEIVDNRNFINLCLSKLFYNISYESTNGRLKSRARRLKEFIKGTLKWEVESLAEENEEEKPVVVEF